jgi:hypothetical protein
MCRSGINSGLNLGSNEGNFSGGIYYEDENESNAATDGEEEEESNYDYNRERYEEYLIGISVYTVDTHSATSRFIENRELIEATRQELMNENLSYSILSTNAANRVLTGYYGDDDINKLIYELYNSDNMAGFCTYHNLEEYDIINLTGEIINFLSGLIAITKINLISDGHRYGNITDVRDIIYYLSGLSRLNPDNISEDIKDYLNERLEIIGLDDYFSLLKEEALIFANRKLDDIIDNLNEDISGIFNIAMTNINHFLNMQPDRDCFEFINARYIFKATLLLCRELALSGTEFTLNTNSAMQRYFDKYAPNFASLSEGGDLDIISGEIYSYCFPDDLNALSYDEYYAVSYIDRFKKILANFNDIENCSYHIYNLSSAYNDNTPEHDLKNTIDLIKLLNSKEYFINAAKSHIYNIIEDTKIDKIGKFFIKQLFLGEKRYFLTSYYNEMNVCEIIKVESRFLIDAINDFIEYLSILSYIVKAPEKNHYYGNWALFSIMYCALIYKDGKTEHNIPADIQIGNFFNRTNGIRCIFKHCNKSTLDTIKINILSLLNKYLKIRTSDKIEEIKLNELIKVETIREIHKYLSSYDF